METPRRTAILPGAFRLFGAFSAIFALALLPAACQRDGGGPDVPETAVPVEHGLIVLGERLDDPYTVENVNRALRSLYPTRAERVDVNPTDLYVRFLPGDEAAYERLTGLGVQMTDHPLDYRIVREGDYYHDPALDEEAITWQYAVVPHDFVFPEDIPYELIDRCYITEHDRTATRGADGIDWAFHARLQPQDLKKRVIRKYAESVVANKYIHLYQQLVKERL